MRRIFSRPLLLDTLKQFYRKVMLKGQAYELTQQGISLFELMLFSHRFLRLLRKDILRHDYQQSPLYTKTIWIKNKERVVSILQPIDQLIQSRLAQALSQLYYQDILSCVYSYVPRKNAYLAATNFKHFLKACERNDVFVLRSDIVSYTNNIILDEHSTLWPKLDVLVDKLVSNKKEQAYLKAQIRSFLKPTLINEAGEEYRNKKGLPMGIPLTTLAANLYLDDFDKNMLSVPDLFYARYGDDMLFAHRDPNVLLKVADLLDSELKKLGLSRQAEKDLTLYMTRGGIPSKDSRWQSASHVEYIGFRVSRMGQVGLTSHRYSLVWNRIKVHIDRSLTLLKKHDKEARCRLICLSLQKAFDPQSAIADRGIQDMLTMVDDRGQLKQFDYQLARYLSEKITGLRSVKTFRELSYRSLREKYGLPSLVAMKNKLF